MKCFTRDARRLLLEMEKEINMVISRTNYVEAHEAVSKLHQQLHGVKPFFGVQYIYRLYTRVKRAKREDEAFDVNETYMNQLAKALEYDSYSDFLSRKHPAINRVLADCEGTWYSYVRCNSGEDFVLRAPVRIYPERRSMRMELRGKERTYKGELMFEENNLYCLLQSEQVKRIFLILRTGLSFKPGVLQGVFTGLSTAGDPISGREVFVRQYEPFEKLKHKRLPINALLETGTEEERVIAHYFRNKENNVLKAGHSSTFELGDLAAGNTLANRHSRTNRKSTGVTKRKNR